MDHLCRHLDRAMPRALARDETHALARAIRDCAATPDAARRYVPDILRLMAEAPDQPEPQLIAAELLALAHPGRDMRATWAGILARFPDNADALYHLARHDLQSGDAPAALGLIDAVLSAPGHATAPDGAYIAGLRALCATFPDIPALRVRLSQMYQAAGALGPAFDTLAGGDPEDVAPAVDAETAAARQALEHRILTLERVSPGASLKTPVFDPAFAAALRRFAGDGDSRPCASALGRVEFFHDGPAHAPSAAMLARMARAITHLHRVARNTSGAAVTGDLEILIQNRGPQSDADALVAQMAGGDAAVRNVTELPEAAADLALDAETRALLPILPPNSRQNFARLLCHFRETPPQVLVMADRAAVTSALLPALVAGVPRIAIFADPGAEYRGPDHRDICHAMAQIPAIGLAVATPEDRRAIAAIAGTAPDRISLLRPAVFPDPVVVEHAQDHRWRAFEATAKVNSLTIGIFCAARRDLDADLAATAEILAAYPETRFIWCADTDQSRALRRILPAHGLSRHVFVTGARTTPRFWIAKFDLCICFGAEAQPAQLIEAQLAGVPVIAIGTGAGGIVQDGRTGLVIREPVFPGPDLPGRDFPGPDSPGPALVAGLDRMLAGQPGLAEMARNARIMANHYFDPDLMLNQTLRFLMGEVVDAAAEQDRPPNVMNFPRMQHRNAFDPGHQPRYNAESHTSPGDI